MSASSKFKSPLWGSSTGRRQDDGNGKRSRDADSKPRGSSASKRQDKSKKESALEIDLRGKELKVVPCSEYEGQLAHKLLLQENKLKGRFHQCFGPESSAVRKLCSSGFLRTLRYLDVSHNKLTRLQGVEYFTHLTVLNASHNKLSTLKYIRNLPNLGALILTHNSIADGDLTELAGLPVLNTLVISSNPKLGSLKGIVALPQLRKLSAAETGLSSLPAELSGLRELSEIRLTNNNLTDISSLMRLHKVTILELGNNPVSQDGDAFRKQMMKAFARLRMLNGRATTASGSSSSFSSSSSSSASPSSSTKETIPVDHEAEEKEGGGEEVESPPKAEPREDESDQRLEDEPKKTAKPESGVVSIQRAKAGKNKKARTSSMKAEQAKDSALSFLMGSDANSIPTW